MPFSLTVSRPLFLSLFCLAASSRAVLAQTPSRARVIAQSKDVAAIAHLDIAPNDNWMLSSSGDGTDFWLWNLNAPTKPRALPGQFFAWSRDGARLATWDDPKLDSDFKGKQRLTILDLNSQRVVQRALDLPTSDSAAELSFAPNGQSVMLKSSNYKRTFVWNFNARTGKKSATKETQSSRPLTATATRHFVQSDYQEVGTQVQVYDLTGRKIYDWHNPSEYDVWKLSSDGALMWRSSFDTSRFNFYDAPSGRLLWRLPTTEADSGSFGHYPQWSKNGKVVGFIKGQTLRTYDARTGKVLHTMNVCPFNLSAFAPGDVYALSRRGDFLIIADARPQLWHVRLK